MDKGKKTLNNSGHRYIEPLDETPDESIRNLFNSLNHNEKDVRNFRQSAIESFNEKYRKIPGPDTSAPGMGEGKKARTKGEMSLDPLLSVGCACGIGIVIGLSVYVFAS